jgi:diaminohydroxyphosphoribosylaminopyrimidine deaminase/5-amino-6-(5-phosphoribosylamino)uracil reductase
MDPDPRTSGAGVKRIEGAGVAVALQDNKACRGSLTGYLTRSRHGRPHVTLKLALSEDLRLARPPGGDQWLTGEIARAHVHAQRAKMDAILVGRGTLEADNPRLDVRLPGLELRSPERFLLTSGDAPAGWTAVSAPAAIHSMHGIQYLMVEGGAATARAFLEAGLVDRMMLYRAPVTAGGDAPALTELAPDALATAGWTLTDSRPLGSDRFEVYERA